jgi:hypothetical protein
VTAALVDAIHSATPDLGTWVEVASLSQADPNPTQNRLALCLYAIEEHPHLRNRPLQPTAAGYVRPPLAVRLSYLMTYVGGADEAQLRLARVLAVFHTRPILGPTTLDPALGALVGQVTVRLRSTTADERNQVWGALGRPARLSLYYDVDVAPVEPLAQEGRGRIDTHRIDYVGLP